VPVETAYLGERSTLNLNDRNPQSRGVDHELVERCSPFRNHQKANGLPSGSERFLDGPTSGDDLVRLGNELAEIRGGWARLPVLERSPRPALAPRLPIAATIRASAETALRSALSARAIERLAVRLAARLAV
jgi:hypothetical protein